MDHGTENGTTQISFRTCGTDSLAGPNSIHYRTSSKWFEWIIHVIRFIHPHTLCCHKGLQHLSRELRDGLPRDDTRQGGGLTNLRYIVLWNWITLPAVVMMLLLTFHLGDGTEWEVHQMIHTSMSQIIIHSTPNTPATPSLSEGSVLKLFRDNAPRPL